MIKILLNDLLKLTAPEVKVENRKLCFVLQINRLISIWLTRIQDMT